MTSMSKEISKKKFFEEVQANDSSKRKYGLMLGNGLTMHCMAMRNYSEDTIQQCNWRELLRNIINNSKSKNERLKEGLLALLVEENDISEIEVGMLTRELLFRNSRKTFEEAMADAITKKFNLDFASGKKIDRIGILDYAWEHDFHILTINYDTNIEEYISAAYGIELDWHSLPFQNRQQRNVQKQTSGPQDELKEIRSQGKSSIWGKSTHYQWNSFIGESADYSGLNSLALKHDIWHIHGSLIRAGQENVRTLISFIDYANAMHYARGLGDPMNPNVKIHKTWLDIFLNSPLIISGMALSSQELLLRRLLVARKHYLDSCKLKLPNSFYLYKKDKIAEGLFEILDFVGIKCVSFDDFPEIYNFIQKDN